MNIEWSRQIIQRLFAEGVDEIIACAGARNSPLIAVLAQVEGLKVSPFFEERSAAFYALGVARKTGKPVAIITTSGTAAAELLPATVEAQYSGVPLVLLTADRPRRLRDTGAPQSINQINLFKNFVQLEFDLADGEIFDLDAWNRRSPIHLNICFDEPLMDEVVAPLLLLPTQRYARSRDEFWGRPRSTNMQDESAMKSDPYQWASSQFSTFLAQNPHPIVIVGTLETDQERESVLRFLARLKTPIYLEGTSGLRGHPELRTWELESGDQILSWAYKQKLLPSVLRIGGIPTVRVWRDLDDPSCLIDVFSISSLEYSGLGRGEKLNVDLVEFINAWTAAEEWAYQEPEKNFPENIQFIVDKDKTATQELERILHDEPRSEVSLIRKLAQLIDARTQADDVVYVGNSLPIREWDLVARPSHSLVIQANRGVNGIDGQVSTFLGLMKEGRENWAILGDLTTLYDLAGPWALKYKANARMKLIVINNSGGKIFSRLFSHHYFENNHELGFESWAKMWNMKYGKWNDVPENSDAVENLEVIEVIPDNEASRRFWTAYDAIWK